MDISAMSKVTAIEKYKDDILQFMVINPETAAKKGAPDSVQITDIGKLLYDLSKAGNAESRAIITNLMAGRPDENLGNFLQAYCYIYGYDFSSKAGYYDRYGRRSYGEYYAALKKYLSTFGDYLLDEPEKDETEESPLAKFLKKRLKQLAGYFKS